jgi:hypothetical protein
MTILANVGIPLFSRSAIYQVLLLLPIIAIEAYLHRRTLSMSWKRATAIATLTNVISTIIGGVLFMVFGAWLGVQLFGSSVPVTASFPLPPLEIMITLIPMFAFSVAIERLIGGFWLRKFDGKQVTRSFVIANAFTYLMLEILAITQLVRSLYRF